MPASSSPIPAVFGMRPAATRISLHSMLLITRGRTHGKTDLLSASAMHMEELGLQEDLNAFVIEYPQYLMRDIFIFVTGIAAAEHDLMVRSRAPEPQYE